MKLSYILQLKDFLIVFLIGIIVGIIYGILSILPTTSKSIALKIFNDLICTLLAFATFLFLVLKINLGQFRLFLLIGYMLGIIFERLTLGKLFAKGYKCVYNKLIILAKKIAKSKFGKVFLKWKAIKLKLLN